MTAYAIGIGAVSGFLSLTLFAMTFFRDVTPEQGARIASASALWAIASALFFLVAK